MRLIAVIILAASLFGPAAGGQAKQDEVSFDYREVMVPMRDGVRLQTVILTPKDAGEALPFLFERTPYGVPPAKAFEKATPLSAMPSGRKYIRVIQNLRGRFKSEGKFVMQRPPHDPTDPKGIDETTDAWDTVDWLVKNVPGNNGKAGIRGTSYSAWTATMAALDPHQAVKAIIEEASPADMFLGDDFHHNGAFRLSYGFEYSAMLETTAEQNYRFQFDRADTYDWYLGLGPLRNADLRHFRGKIPTWTDFVRHPNFDEFWQRQTVIRYLNAAKAPILHVAGWWDQEDFYGPQQIYEKLEARDDKSWNFFVAGPWDHGGWHGEATRLGPITFGSATGKYYNEKIHDVWFDYWLRAEGSLQLAEATTFETGSNQWRQYEAWPPKRGVTERRLYFGPGRRLSYDPPAKGTGYDEYVSDPANPVPYRPRPVPRTYPGPEWPEWMVQDQRFVDYRPDVLSWETEPLAADLRVVGRLTAELFASTSGTDGDWVVKLIDIYPEDAPPDDTTKKIMGGYQLMIAGEIFRGRFRESFERPKPIPANKPVKYVISLHTNDHVFLKGHRIMVQVQSTWFPLYDRNPQRFVPNIFEAGEADYRKAVQRVYRDRQRPSAVVLPVMQ